MPTPIFVCGAECGIAAVGTPSAGTEHWSSINGAPSVVTSGPSSMRSTRAFRSQANQSLTHTFASAIGSPATIVGRFYINFATLPSASMDLIQTTSGGTNLSVRFVSSDNSIRAGSSTTSGDGGSGVVVTTGVWYRVDFKGVCNTTTTCDVQVDGVAVAQYSVAGSAASITGFAIGLSGASGDAYYDDIVMSGTSGNYPIGAGTVVGQYPSADGTHGGGWASGVFGKGTSGGTNASNTDTDIWQSLDNPLVTTAAGSWVSNNTATATTNYVEFRNAPTSPAMLINGAMFVFTTHSASATANNINIDINDGAGHTATLISVLDLSESTITVPVVVRNTDANGVAWTPDTLAANRTRFSGTDSNPDAYLDGYVIEADIVPQPGGRNVYVAPSQAAQTASRW